MLIDTGLGMNLDFYLKHINPKIEDTFPGQLDAINNIEKYILRKLNYFFNTDYYYSRLIMPNSGYANFNIYDKYGDYVGYYPLLRVQFNKFMAGEDLEPKIGSKFFQIYTNKKAA